MAELHVQRKRNNYGWLWLLLIILLIAAGVYYYMNYYNKDGNTVSNSVTNVAVDSSTNRQNNAVPDTTSAANNNTGFWDEINFDSPDTTYTEVNDKKVNVKTNARYVIYSINNNTLFDNNKSELLSEGKNALKKICASISQRYQNDEVRIYNHIDLSNQKENNDQLAEQREEAVKRYLVNNSKVIGNRISIAPNGKQSSSVSKTPAGINVKSDRIDIVVKR